MLWRQVELPITPKMPVVLRGNLPGAMSAKQKNPQGNWGETVSRNEWGPILHLDAELGYSGVTEGRAGPWRHPLPPAGRSLGWR